MRTRWVPGHVREGTTDYPGRYNAPWLETTDADSAIYVTHPFEDAFELDDWIELLWRVSQWTITWSMELSGPTFYHEAHGVETSAVYSAATKQLIGGGEEHKLGAGFYHLSSRYPDPENPNEHVGFSMHAVGTGHKYYPASGGVPQKFRPLVGFSHNLTAQGQNGPSDPVITSYLTANSTPGGTATNGTVRLVFNGVERTALPSWHILNVPGPIERTLNVTIEASGWWPYAKADGTDPIWNTANGASLRGFRAAPSTEGDGTILVPGGGVRRFVGK